MSETLLSIAGISAAGGLTVLLVLLVRLTLRPSRRICCVMWLLAGLRLLMPFSLGDIFGLELPELRLPTAASGSPYGVYETAAPQTYAPDGGAAENTVIMPEKESAAVTDSHGEQKHHSVSAGAVLTALWLAGAAGVAGAAASGYVKLRLRLRTAVRMEEDIYRSEHIPTPFVMGILRPRIYIPCSVAEGDIPFVLEHERNHIKRNDHITKAAALAVLALHWFNPLVWVGFVLFCRDVETACDEKVIAGMDIPRRRMYSAALLACSTDCRTVLCPVAFGEVGVKERITHIMKYKRPAFAKTAVSALLCIVLMLCVLVLPVGCAGKTAPVEFRDINLSDPAYEGTDRITLEDGSVTMLFVPESSVGSDTIQTFRYADKGYTVTAGVTDGFITAPNEDGRVIYLTTEDLPAGTEAIAVAYLTSTDEEGYISITDLGASISTDSASDFVWIPREINFDDHDGKIGTVITFTISDGEQTVDTVEITVTTDETAVAPEGMTVLKYSVDKNHSIHVDHNDHARTIIIEKN